MTVERAAENDGAAVRPTARRSEQRDQPRAALILVVDDDKMNRVVMSAVLRQLGYRFDLATNGREAVDAVRRERYDAVLMDCLMPEMDGYEATMTIRQEERLHRVVAGARRRLPIIAVTAVAIQGARERCIAAGMDDYLTKPVVLQSVAGVLDRWLHEPEADASWSPERAVAPDEDDDVIDQAALDALRDLDPDTGDALIAEVVRDFAAEVAPSFGRLRAAVAEEDLISFLQQVHFIAGCASIVGAVQVERLARSIEHNQPVDDYGRLRGGEPLVEQLEAAFMRATTALEVLVAAAAARAARSGA